MVSVLPVLYIISSTLVLDYKPPYTHSSYKT